MVRVRLASAFLGSALLVMAFVPAVSAQAGPSVGDSGPAVGEFAETDGACGSPNFTDDTYEATLGEDGRGRFIRLTQTSTGDTGIFRLDTDGVTVVFETEGDEEYNEIVIDGNVLRAVYVYTWNGCRQIWFARIELPPGFLEFLAQTPAAEEPPPPPTTEAATTTEAPPTTQPPTTAPPVTTSADTSPPAAAEDASDSGSAGLPGWAWWLIGLILLALVLIWFSARTVGGRGGRAPGDNGDDPRDTTPPAVYGEELEQFIIKYCFYVPPNQLKKAAQSPSRTTVRKRTKAREKHQKRIDHIVERRNEGKETKVDDEHRKQIGSNGTADRWIDAIYWWQEQINAQCIGKISIDAVIELKPIDSEALTDEDGKPLDHFAKTEKLAKEKASERWVAGQNELDSLTRQGDTTRTHFHISLFKYVRVKSNTKTDGIIFGPAEGVKPPPFSNFGAVLRKPSSSGELHEVGHLFGLEHGDGGIMDKKGNSYGKGFVFDDAKCRKVIRQLKGA